MLEAFVYFVEDSLVVHLWALLEYHVDSNRTVILGHEGTWSDSVGEDQALEPFERSAVCGHTILKGCVERHRTVSRHVNERDGGEAVDSSNAGQGLKRLG